MCRAGKLEKQGEASVVFVDAVVQLACESNMTTLLQVEAAQYCQYDWYKDTKTRLKTLVASQNLVPGPGLGRFILRRQNSPVPETTTADFVCLQLLLLALRGFTGIQNMAGRKRSCCEA